MFKECYYDSKEVLEQNSRKNWWASSRDWITIYICVWFLFHYYKDEDRGIVSGYIGADWSYALDKHNINGPN